MPASTIAPDAPPRLPGPSLRQDIPRPPLRRLALQTRRRTRLGLAAAHIALRRAADRARATTARTVARTVARLDAHVWQPAMWPFRPAQREILAETLAVLAVAIVALGWIVAYNTLAPAEAARPPALPAAAPKPFTERVVSPALPIVDVPLVEAPHPVPAPNRRPPQP